MRAKCALVLTKVRGRADAVLALFVFAAILCSRFLTGESLGGRNEAPLCSQEFAVVLIWIRLVGASGGSRAETMRVDLVEWSGFVGVDARCLVLVAEVVEYTFHSS